MIHRMISALRCQSSLANTRLAISLLLLFAIALATCRGHWLTPCGVAIEFLMLTQIGERLWRFIAGQMFVLAIAIAVLAAIQIGVGIPRARGPFASPNFLGYYAVAHVFLALAWRPMLPRLAPVAMWSSAIAVALSGSRASLLAAATAVIIPRARRHPVLAAASAGIAFASLLLVPRDIGRFEIWRLGASLAATHPWFGWGEGGITVLGLPGFYSVPLDWTLRAGLVGLAAAAWATIEAWRSDKSLRPFVIAWIVNGLFIFGTPESATPMLVAFAWLGRRRGLDVAQVAVRHDGADRRAANAGRWAERKLPHLARLGE